MREGHLAEFKYTSLMVNQRARLWRRGSTGRVRSDVRAILQSGALATGSRNILTFPFSYENVLEVRFMYFFSDIYFIIIFHSLAILFLVTNN